MAALPCLHRGEDDLQHQDADESGPGQPLDRCRRLFGHKIDEVSRDESQDNAGNSHDYRLPVGTLLMAPLAAYSESDLLSLLPY
jgi:hypothetical protein